MKKQHGYTLQEIMITVGITGVLSAISIYGYTQYIPNMQVAEATRLMAAEKTKISKNISRGYCANNQSGARGKYGTLVVSGQYGGAGNDECPTGCRLTYTFKDTGVHPKIKEKRIGADVLNNMALSRVRSTTTLPEKYMPKALIELTAPSNCSIAADTDGHDWADVNVPDNKAGDPIQTPPDDIPGGGNPPEIIEEPPTDTEPNPGGGDEDWENRLVMCQSRPPTDAEKAERIAKIQKKLSEGHGDVVIEPECFNYTVVATPKAKNADRVCEDKLDIRENEWVYRINANQTYANDRFFSVRGQFAIMNEMSGKLGIKSNRGVPYVDKQIAIYNPCHLAIVNKSPRRPSVISNNYSIDKNDGALRIINHGVISGRAGNGTVFDLEANVLSINQTYKYNEFEIIDGRSYPSDSYLVFGHHLNIYPFPMRTMNPKTFWVPYKDDFAENEPTSEKSLKAVYGDEWIQHADIRGGVAVLNLNEDYAITVDNFGLVNYGYDGFSELAFTAIGTYVNKDPKTLEYYTSGVEALGLYPRGQYGETINTAMPENFHIFRNTTFGAYGRSSYPLGEPIRFMVNHTPVEKSNATATIMNENVPFKDYFGSQNKAELVARPSSAYPGNNPCFPQRLYFTNADTSSASSEKFTFYRTLSECSPNISIYAGYDKVREGNKYVYGQSQPEMSAGYTTQNHLYFVGKVVIGRDSAAQPTNNSYNSYTRYTEGTSRSVADWLQVMYNRFNLNEADHCLTGNSENKFITREGKQINCFWRGMSYSELRAQHNHEVRMGLGGERHHRFDNRYLIGEGKAKYLSYPGMGDFGRPVSKPPGCAIKIGNTCLKQEPW